MGSVRIDKVFIDKFQRVSQQTFSGVSATIINSFILSFILWGVIPIAKILIWLLSICTISVIRLLLSHVYRETTSGLNAAARGRKCFFITLAISGIIWGSAGILLYSPASIAHQVFVAFVLGGMVAGSVGVFSVFIADFLAFSIPILLPITVRFLYVHDEMHYAMGTMIALFWLVIFLTARQMNKEITKYFNLKYENLDLISELEREINERKSAEKALRRKNQEIEGIVQDRTAELQNVNAKLISEIEERRYAEEALRDSEEKFRELANSLPQIVFETDERGKIAFANRNAFDIFGYTEDEAYEELDAFQVIVPEDRDRAMEKFFREWKDGNSSGNEYTAQRKDGSTFPILIHANPIIRENKFIGARGIVIDLTDQKNAEEEKKELENQLQRAQKMEAIGALAGGVAHDLNNILSGIVSYPDLMLMDLPKDSHLRKPIMTMQDSGKRAAAIVQDLLTLTRRGIIIEEIVSLNEIVSKYLISPEYKKMISYHSGVEVEADLATDLFNISGSPIHLAKTVMNLVSNAAEAMQDGGKIRISTSNRSIEKSILSYGRKGEEKYVTLSVSDNGIGIPPKDQDRIFEPFFTKKTMGRSGTGLGMAVVWGTVEDHNGHIDLKSSEGEGTTITLFFPASKQELTPVEPEGNVDKLRGNGESILVVDDSKRQREISYDLLSRLGYAVSVTSSGEDAIEFIKNNRIDLVVLDMLMNPGMDGLDTYRNILQICPKQRAIIVSGFSKTERVKEAIRLGAGTYVKKPYTLRRLGKAVRIELDG